MSAFDGVFDAVVAFLRSKIELPRHYTPASAVNVLDFYKRPEAEGFMQEWNGFNRVSSLYRTHLFDFYDTACSSNAIISLHLLRFGSDELSKEPPQFYDTITNIKRCLQNPLIEARQKQNILISLNLFSVGNLFGSAHANMLVFRTNQKTLEHFEPQYMPKRFENRITGAIDSFAEQLSEALKLPEPIRVKHWKSMCPQNIGPQALEKHYNKSQNSSENMYCLAWSLLFLETVLEFPQFSSEDIIHALTKISHGDLRPYIRGYSMHILNTIWREYQWIFEEYHFTLVGTDNVLDEIVESIMYARIAAQTDPDEFDNLLQSAKEQLISQEVWDRQYPAFKNTLLENLLSFRGTPTRPALTARQREWLISVVSAKAILKHGKRVTGIDWEAAVETAVEAELAALHLASEDGDRALPHATAAKDTSRGGTRRRRYRRHRTRRSGHRRIKKKYGRTR
jgi:hypothetical protein